MLQMVRVITDRAEQYVQLLLCLLATLLGKLACLSQVCANHQPPPDIPRGQTHLSCGGLALQVGCSHVGGAAAVHPTCSDVHKHLWRARPQSYGSPVWALVAGLAGPGGR